MELLRACSGWIGRFALLSSPFFLTACMTTTTVVAPSAQPSSAAVTSPGSGEEDEFTELIAQLRADLNRYNSREADRTPKKADAKTSARSQRDKEFADRARALFAPLESMQLRMPVVGVRTGQLYDSWHQPRDGGKRKHTGIDIFAPKGTPLVAVVDGVISFIGEQPKGGLCLWLTTENGQSFYYAHLDRWAAGIYEGMEVSAGDLLGYVGNTGNAKTTPPHLHFAINDNDEMVNPYPVLTNASYVSSAQVHTQLGGGFGTK
ncbi:MAG TPA: M23 family metallopeptidase [Thermoanaerobaculia bacterium]|jgi:murein DD-endopeptidase MepM/ murein hydrolase activator NlpD